MIKDDRLRIAKALLGSVCVWTLLFLFAWDITIQKVRPLRYVNTTALSGLNQNPVVAKLVELFRSKRHPDVMITGSSLTLVPAVRLDDQLKGRKTRYDSWYYRNRIQEYDRADYLQSLLSKKARKPLDVSNVGIVGSMMSDHYLIYQKSVKTGKKPGLLICLVAPRDFLDHYRSEVEKTPTYLVLADLTCLKDLLESSPELKEVVHLVVGNIWYHYKSRADYKTFLTALTCKITGHSPTLYSAATQKEKAVDPHPGYNSKEITALEHVEPVFEAPPNTLPDLDLYKKVYLPLDMNLYKTQMQYLDKMLKLARNEGTKVMLVDTPLPAENYAILPAGFLDKYRRDIKAVCDRHEASLVSPADSRPFETRADFEDACHMNASGGKKVYAAIVDSIEGDPRLARALAGSRAIAGAGTTH